MRAITIPHPGGPEVLTLTSDLRSPTPQRSEARVRVRAAGVNRADLLQRMGHYPAPPDAPRDIPGLELAGEVDAVGDGVTAVKPGDRVFGLVGGGAYAEHIVVHERTLVRIPNGLSFVEAASIPEAFVTAYDAMVAQAGLAAGETVLIHAAGSGVGTAAIQIARAIGATSIGTARGAGKLDRARPMGLGEGVVAEDGKFAEKVLNLTGGRGVDVVVDLVGGAYVAESIACAAHRARIVVVGLLAGARAEIDLRLLLHKRIELRGTVLRARPIEEKIAAAHLLGRHLGPLFASRQLEPVVDRVLPLAQAEAAHRYMAGNELFGKVVLEID